jgi:ribosomal protein S18 acetylase RimI-like enzyme
MNTNVDLLLGENEMKEPRLFENEADLLAMQALVSEGTLARTGTRYVHPGDLAWWYEYTDVESDIRSHTYLWYGAHTLQGFAILSTGWCTMDLFVRPFLLGTGLHGKMLDWVTAKAVEVYKARGKDQYSMMWIAQDDAVTTRLLESRGFLPAGNASVTLRRLLDDEIPAPVLPEGFRLRSCKGLAEVEARALAQYRAFESERPLDRYTDRWRRFMQSPVYNPELDVVAVAPDGRIASFCILWEDHASRTGSFEPVGTDPEFQRMGLGRAVMTEGLRRLKASGMKTAWVTTGSENQPAVALYRATGFNVWHLLGHWTKQIEPEMKIEMPVYDLTGIAAR